MKYCIKPIVVTIFALLTSILYANQPTNLHFDQISTQDGLSQNTVRAIIEDRQGFIWAGTLDGLNRYDGYRFLTYKPELGNTNSLIDHRVKDMFQDKEGYLWIKTYKNEFNCYDPMSNRFVDYSANIEAAYIDYYESESGDIWLWGGTDGCLLIKRDNGKLTSTPYFVREEAEEKINCKFLYEDNRSTVWVGANTGLYKITDSYVDTLYCGQLSFTRSTEINNKIYFSTNEGYIVEYDKRRNLYTEFKSQYENANFINLAQLNNNELMIVTTTHGIILFNVNNHSFTKPQWSEDSNLSGSIDFLTDSKGDHWIYNKTGYLWHFNKSTQSVKRILAIPQDRIKGVDSERYNVLIDSEGIVWITTYGNGLLCYDENTGETINYRNANYQNSPASDYLLSITEDKHGNIWIGSEYAGIIKVVKPNYHTTTIRPESESSIGKNNNVRTILEDVSGNYWIGTKNGSLYVYDHSLTDGKCILKDINPYTLIQSSHEHIWVGTKGNGLFIIDQSSRKVIAHYEGNRRHAHNSNNLSHIDVFNILRDNKNRMWVGTFGGGISMVEDKDAETLSFKHYFLDEGSRSYIRCIYQDRSGTIWAGTCDGLIKFDPDELIHDPQAYTVYKMNLNQANSITSNDIKTIYEDNEGVLWVGTAGGGLNRLITATPGTREHFISYTSKNGLSGDFITGILEDSDGHLWISSESGITRFNKSNSSSMIFNFSEKTYGNHFNENAGIYGSNGTMLWGSLDGLLIFNPESFTYKENNARVVLTNLFVFNQLMKANEKDSPLKESLCYSSSISLNHSQNTFTIEFSTLDLKEPHKNKYSYMLEGFDKEWSSIEKTNSATYKSLTAGQYIFKVKGSNSDGVWSDEITSLSIVITPPFWQSPYAYLLYILLITFIIFIAFRLVYKINTLNNNIKVEKELTSYKLHFFTNISHEFRTPLTLIRGSVENLNNQSNVPEQTKKQIKVLNHNANILSRLIDQLLEFRKIQNNQLSLDLEVTNIIEFTREIFNNFNEIALQKNIEYLFKNDCEEYNIYIDRKKIDKVLYNLLSNAFKFTKNGGRIELCLSFSESNKTCLISVRDNGIGVEKEKQHLLFNRFKQVNFSATGSGVGLSLVKEFAEVHKGRVWFEDNKPIGSIFNIELSTEKEIYAGENFLTPTTEDNIVTDGDYCISSESSNVPISLPEIDDSTLSNYKMLIVDDNEDIRNFLVDEFSKYFMVDTAEDGKVGLQKAIDTNPDLIICDVMMPEMDGFEVTSHLKEDFQTCHIPVILLTAHSSLHHQLEGINRGADAYIMKPFSLQYLVRRVFKLIEQREQLKKRFSKVYVPDESLMVTVDKDKEFYKLLESILESSLSDSQFSVERFAELTKISRTIFYKKVKGITGLSPNELIKVTRMKKAAELLIDKTYTISEVAYKVGFDDPYYFSRCFKAQFNCSPSKFSEKVLNREEMICNKV